MISKKLKLYHLNHSIDNNFICVIYKLNLLIKYTFQWKKIFAMQNQYQEKAFRERIFTFECVLRANFD